MQIAVGEEHKAAVERFCIFARLLLADQRIFVFRLGFQHQQRKVFFIQQQEVDKTVAGSFKIPAQIVDFVRGEFDVGFQRDVGLSRGIVEKASACGFKQLVDLDSGLGFFGGGHIWICVVRAGGRFYTM
ncbi:MAG: hypothetical protein LBS89_06215 [Zoogloeaceae bacterium]|jgi:hypothetical protein|nr:hypothetical protein [Zoogloeaceae bacterium]